MFCSGSGNKPICRSENSTIGIYQFRLRLPEPDKIGMDRLAGAAAINDRRDSTHAAVLVDAGSAITVDVVSSDGLFLGGVIMAGFGMQTRALYQQTDQIPAFEPDVARHVPPVIGRTTKEAVQSGIFWGTIGSICEFVRLIGEQFGDVDLFVTGGDMELISQHLPVAQYDPNLVLFGIALAAKTLPGLILDVYGCHTTDTSRARCDRHDFRCGGTGDRDDRGSFSTEDESVTSAGAYWASHFRRLASWWNGQSRFVSGRTRRLPIGNGRLGSPWSRW